MRFQYKKVHFNFYMVLSTQVRGSHTHPKDPGRSNFPSLVFGSLKKWRKTRSFDLSFPLFQPSPHPKVKFFVSFHISLVATSHVILPFQDSRCNSLCNSKGKAIKCWPNWECWQSVPFWSSDDGFTFFPFQRDLSTGTCCYSCISRVPSETTHRCQFLPQVWRSSPTKDSCALW